MKAIEQSANVIFWNYEDESVPLKHLEDVGRVAYQSYEKKTENSWKPFIKMIMKREHLGILEHLNVSVRMTTNRAIANEFVRHRHFSYVQESTRYVKYDTGIEFIKPNNKTADWERAMEVSEQVYKNLIDSGQKAQDARGVLPLDLATEMVATGNLRTWLWF